MTREWLQDLAAMAERDGAVVRVSVIRADGSSPRGAGSAMVVGPEKFSGTVGGGALELEALKGARDMLAVGKVAQAGPWTRSWRPFPLGPSLGQCCGGYVELLFELVTPAEAPALREMAAAAPDDAVVLRPLEGGVPMALADAPAGELPAGVKKALAAIQGGRRVPEAARVDDWYLEPAAEPKVSLFLYGAGHVGRAVVKVLADLPFEIYWVDTQAERYPAQIPASVNRLVSADPAAAVLHAPANAWHVVMTFSHAIDFDVCRAVLAKGAFAYLGLIASKTKRVRFRKRLAEAGIPDAEIARLHAPIGLPGIDGKEPAIIAVSLAADLLMRLHAEGAETADPDLDEASGDA